MGTVSASEKHGKNSARFEAERVKGGWESNGFAESEGEDAAAAVSAGCK